MAGRASSYDSAKRLHKTLRLLAKKGGYRALKLAAAKIPRRGLRLRPAILTYQAEMMWADGDHAAVRLIAGILIEKYRCPTGHLYLAQDRFVHGDLAGAMDQLRPLLEIDPYHAEGTYLFAQCAAASGDYATGWAALERIALHSRRPKTWLRLAAMVRDGGHFLALLELHSRAVAQNVITHGNPDIAMHLAHAALNCGNYEQAKTMLRQMVLERGMRAKPPRRPRRRKAFSLPCASRALADLKAALEPAGIEMFLVSGTLLGCIREGRLLSHDNDIDVGVWSDTCPDAIRTAVQRGGLFFPIPSRSGEILRFRHLNGVPIDLFFHHKVPGDCWHAGVKIKWHNTPFDLKPITFLGQEYLIPADHENYLRENYTDWRKPQKNFDSAFDTPNAEVIQSDELVVHSLVKLFQACRSGAAEKAEFYLRKLEERGETGFVAEYPQNRCRGLRGVWPVTRAVPAAGHFTLV